MNRGLIILFYTEFNRLASHPILAKVLIILSSNKSFSEWGDLFTDQVLATALLDRLLHHSSIINIRGQSYRLKEKRQAGLFQGADTIKESLTS